MRAPFSRSRSTARQGGGRGRTGRRGSPGMESLEEGGGDTGGGERGKRAGGRASGSKKRRRRFYCIQREEEEGRENVGRMNGRTGGGRARRAPLPRCPRSPLPPLVIVCVDGGVGNVEPAAAAGGRDGDRIGSERNTLSLARSLTHSLGRHRARHNTTRTHLTPLHYTPTYLKP